jgi:type I restriction enzyme S subunit
MSECKEYKISELVSLNIIAKPLDGNHGGIHPTTKDYVSKGIPFVMASDINNGNLDLTTCKFLTFEHSSKLKKGFAKEGDVLLTHKASIGRTAIVPKLNAEYIVLTPQVTYYRVLDETRLNNFYLMYYFNSLEFQNLLITFSGSGSTRAYIGITEQLNLSIKLPPIILQKQIAEILSSLDDKIELNNKINQELENLAQTLFKQWFIDFEFPNENGEPYKSSGGEMVESELGEIPKGWEVGKFGDLVNIINGYAFKSKDFNDFSTEGIIKIRNINGTLVDIVNTDFVSPEVVNNLNNKFKIESGEILIAMTGAEVGKIGVVAKTNKRLWLNQRVGKITPKNSNHISYIHTMFNVLNFTEVVRNEAMGSAQPNISSQGIENIKTLIPEINLIHNFSSLYNDKFRLFYESLSENQELTNLRDTLLPKLISGELEINETSN